MDMDMAGWVGTVVVAWVTLSVLVALVVGRVAKFGDQQVAAMPAGRTAGPALVKRTSVWRSTVAANGRVRHRQVA
jgi:hypothetical protein